MSTLNFGIFLVYWIDYAFSSHTGSYAWRVPVILQCICIIPILVILTLIPETPRWLASHDRPDECLEILARIHSAPTDNIEVQRLHNTIIQTVAYEASIGAGSWKDLLKNDRIKSQKRLLIACAIQSFQQLGGINAIICKTQTSCSLYLEKTRLILCRLLKHFVRTQRRLQSQNVRTHVRIFADLVLRRIVHSLVFNRPCGKTTIGKPILGNLKTPLLTFLKLLSMISLMAAVMAIQAGLIYQVQNNTAIAHAAGIGAAAMLFIFQGAFTVGFQATVWVYPYVS